jgi:hypothetical protein
MPDDPDSVKALLSGLDIITPALLPPDPKRRVYTVLRERFVESFGEFLGNVFAERSPDRTLKLSQSRKTFEEIVSWVSPPHKPLTSEQALNLIGSNSHPVWRDAIFQMIGKHLQRGQPRSKRHLAVLALDMKCAQPTLTRRAVTDALCPCGKGVGQHSDRCREQLRQQINRLVKFLKTLGYDFTWERIGTEGWKESE